MGKLVEFRRGDTLRSRHGAVVKVRAVKDDRYKLAHKVAGIWRGMHQEWWSLEELKQAGVAKMKGGGYAVESEAAAGSQWEGLGD